MTKSKVKNMLNAFNKGALCFCSHSHASKSNDIHAHCRTRYARPIGFWCDCCEFKPVNSQLKLIQLMIKLSEQDKSK